MAQTSGSPLSAAGAVAKGRVYMFEHILSGAPDGEDSPGMPRFAHLSGVELADLAAKNQNDATLQYPRVAP